MKLYELTQNYLNLQELLENPEIPTEMINVALNEVEGEFEEKAENIAKLIKSIEVDIKGYKEEETRLSNNRKSLENRVKGLKDYLENSMRTLNKNKFKGKLFSFNIQKNAPSVEVVDYELIPERFYIEQDPLLSKKDILQALKDGEDIPGVALKQTESLRIK